LKLAKLHTIVVKMKRHKLILNTVQDFAYSGVVRGASSGIQFWTQPWDRINTLCSHSKTQFYAEI